MTGINKRRIFAKVITEKGSDTCLCIGILFCFISKNSLINNEYNKVEKTRFRIKGRKIVAAFAEARDKGDLAENAEYDAAKEAQGMLEMKINQLKATIGDAKIIDTSKLKADTVQILTRVELKNVKTGMKMAYTIVSETEANLKLGKISVNTPIAQGLLGKKVGDIAEITIPQGKISLEVTGISF